ncbi:MAG TPA: hypothetical protein VLC46_07940 [Thermoanaerobaculia bacterium]|jgi:hypothetical protein|nr:hypothetical protein [Thermoanaerobaculia bacterium]
MRRLMDGVRLPGIVVFLFGVASLAGAQQLLPLQFPDTDRTSVTDCSTPTVLNLPDGGTVTLRGGQFVHYEDDNFYGTMYVTSSAAGCQATGPDFDLLQRPITEVTVTFSKEQSAMTVQTYNLLGPPGMWDGPNPGMVLTFRDAAGNYVEGMGRGFPSHLMNPDPLPYPVSGFSWPPFASISFSTSDPPLASDPFAETATDWQWGITSLAVLQNPIDVTGEILDGSALETKKAVTPDQTIYAQVPLGLELRLGLKRNGAYLPAKYELSPATLSNVATPTLYPTNVVLEYNRALHEGQKTFRGVHLGTQKLTVTPDDTTLKPFTFTLGVFDPGNLGDTDVQYDSFFVLWGNKRGFPPHVLKGLVRQEGPFDPLSYRYEPLSATTGDRFIETQLSTAPYSSYLLSTSTGISRGALLLDLNAGQTAYTLLDDVSPRKSFVLARNAAQTPTPITPLDVCPNACVSARQIFEANDGKQNWSDPSYVGNVDWWDDQHLGLLEFTAQTPTAASYGLMQTMYVRAIELKWQTTDGRQNPSLLFDTQANTNIGGGSISIGTRELYSAYRACNAPDLATDPDFADSAAYQSQMIDAFNWYNHGNADRNVDYGDKAWSFSQQFSPAHPLSKIFP